jgi:PhzF family phenazine biosynthesis protein
MRRIPYFHIDSFTQRPFAGNPAGVCLLEAPLPDAQMQALAAEVNLSETAFVLQSGKGCSIRWFSPKMEIDLCGHATLAAAFALFHAGRATGRRVDFSSGSGPLGVEKRADQLFLDFPVWTPAKAEAPALLVNALGAKPLEVLTQRDYIAVFQSEAEVQNLRPDFALMEKLDRFGVIATAATADGYVCRCFVPKAGLPEDPVTGSAQCELVPYWAAQTQKTSFAVRQLSARGGELLCSLEDERVKIGGHAVLCFETTFLV